MKQKDELSAVIQKIDTRLNNLQLFAFALTNYHFVFQGVMLTIICNGAKNLKPSDRWFLFTISILAVLLNLFALIKTGIKYIETKGTREIFWFRRSKVYGKIFMLDCSYEDEKNKFRCLFFNCAWTFCKKGMRFYLGEKKN